MLLIKVKKYTHTTVNVLFHKGLKNTNELRIIIIFHFLKSEYSAQWSLCCLSWLKACDKDELCHWVDDSTVFQSATLQ
jgi:hypothetical protein